MERQIAYDKLAREDRFVRMRAREVAEAKISQGLAPFPELTSRESIKERAHGILVGEMQAMEGASRTVYDSPARRGSSPWIWRGRSGTSPPRRNLHPPRRTPGGYVRSFPRRHSLALRLRGGRGGAGGRRQPRP